MIHPVTPSIDRKPSSCPHCSAFTTQYWFKLGAEQLESELVPNIRTEEQKGLILGNDKLPNEAKKDLLEHLEKTQSGLVFFASIREYLDHRVFNLHLSKCYHCGKICSVGSRQVAVPGDQIRCASQS